MILRRLKIPKFRFSSFSTSSTLHEESAAGLNGRLARLSSSAPPADLLAFYSRVSPSDRRHLNLSSFNYILEAMLADGRQMDAFRLINQLEGDGDVDGVKSTGFPDKSSFLILMRGLVEADVSGSLALAVDELFELMQKRYNILPDLEIWSLRIRAFLHPKFMNPITSVEPARIFYSEMIKEQLSPDALNELKSDLIITAVNRRLWAYSDWILKEMSINLNFILIDKIASSSGLFLDPSSIPVIRFLLKSQSISDSLILNSVGFNQNLLLFCWRQGKASADLALLALRFLLKNRPDKSNWWIETAEGCLQRELPRDFYVFDAEETRDRLSSTVQRIKCSPHDVKELEKEIIHQKLIT